MTLSLLKEKDAELGGASLPAPSDAAAVEKPAWLRCRRCREPIAERDGVRSRHVFANPAGRVFEILVVKAARLEPNGAPTEEHTWFPGFAWRVGTCVGCGFHLGWIFDPAREGVCFYGLITSELEEG
jgi:hypothetical protein